MFIHGVFCVQMAICLCTEIDPILSRLCIPLSGASPRHILIWQLGSTVDRGAGLFLLNIWVLVLSLQIQYYHQVLGWS